MITNQMISTHAVEEIPPQVAILTPPLQQMVNHQQQGVGDGYQASFAASPSHQVVSMRLEIAVLFVTRRPGCLYQRLPQPTTSLGGLAPAIIASSMRRPDTPTTSLA